MTSKILKSSESETLKSTEKTWGSPIEFLMTCIGKLNYNLTLKFF